MKKYILNYAKSRKIDKYDIEKYPCEVCGMKYIQEIHHVNCSFKGSRSDDPKGLIGCCLECHIKIHKNNNFETRQKLLMRVENILNSKL